MRIQNPDSLSLNLRRTNYKRLYFASRHLKLFREKFGLDLLPRAIGISTILLSSDDRCVFIKRSEWVGDNSGKLDVVGGHIEPDEHMINNVPDPFFAMKDEILEEVGLSPDIDEKLHIIGLFEAAYNKKPELIFLYESVLTFEEIKQTGVKCGCEEVASIDSIANTESTLNDFLNLNRHKLSPSAFGALWTYQKFIRS